MSALHSAQAIDEQKQLLQGLIDRLTRLVHDGRTLADDFAPIIDLLPAGQRESAKNLVHYVALRRHDVRDVQDQLTRLGLSSLGRSERHVLGNLTAVLKVLHRLADQEYSPSDDFRPLDVDDAASRIHEHRRRLLGPEPQGRDVHIMVTMPSEAADDPKLVHDLLASGMNVMRVNCAHDDQAAWGSMIDHLRSACRELGRECRVLMDLGGPKLRTADLPPGPQAIKFRPQRNPLGMVSAPAKLWLFPADQPFQSPSPAAAELPVEGGWLGHVHVGDRIHIEDARGRSRWMNVVEIADHGCWAESHHTTYVVGGARLWLDSASRGAIQSTLTGEGRIGALPPYESAILLRPGDWLRLTLPDVPPQQAAPPERPGAEPTPASIGCSLPAIFQDIKPGERILFDDGKIGGLIRRTGTDEAWIEITQARPDGSKLKSAKGINLPDSQLRLSALTDKDRQDLAFAVGAADMVGLSFVHTADDVVELQAELDRLHGERIGVVLKIETRRGFEELPSLLLAAMHSPAVGVMIARGDLAVECGYERLAELQEEILWVCEAAHAPVIWATQVLENLATRGTPSRAEVTDAAMGERAECVMLNKGPYINQAVRFLDDVLRRMASHQRKKRPMLRRLQLASRLTPPSP